MPWRSHRATDPVSTSAMTTTRPAATCRASQKRNRVATSARRQHTAVPSTLLSSSVTSAIITTGTLFTTPRHPHQTLGTHRDRGNNSAGVSPGRPVHAQRGRSGRRRRPRPVVTRATGVRAAARPGRQRTSRRFGEQARDGRLGITDPPVVTLARWPPETRSVGLQAQHDHRTGGAESWAWGNNPRMQRKQRRHGDHRADHADRTDVYRGSRPARGGALRWRT